MFDFKKNGKYIRRHRTRKDIIIFSKKDSIYSYNTKLCKVHRILREHVIYDPL